MWVRNIRSLLINLFRISVYSNWDSTSMKNKQPWEQTTISDSIRLTLLMSSVNIFETVFIGNLVFTLTHFQVCRLDNLVLFIWVKITQWTTIGLFREQIFSFFNTNYKLNGFLIMWNNNSSHILHVVTKMFCKKLWN